MPTPLLILGRGTFAVEALDIAETAGGFTPLGFVDSIERPAPGATHADLPVFWIDELPHAAPDCVLVSAIVTNRRRAFVDAMRRRGYRFVSLVHPSSTISRRARIGEGCIVNAGAIVSQNTRIDGQVVLNRGCLIGHDVHVESYCSIGPGANIAGAVHVGTGAYIGVGAVVRDHLSIGAGAVIAAGAVVVKAVPPNVMVAGVPAKIVKTDVEGL
jgi:acetyltransferase EpsM